MTKPVTSKSPFFNVRPGRATGPNRQPAIVDAERHPATAKYAKASGHYSPTPRLPDFWQLGYDRFGDDFEALLTGIDSLKPTLYAKMLLDLDDKWKLIGRTEAELRPEEVHAYATATYETRAPALELIARGGTHQRHADILAWTGFTRIAVGYKKGWASSAFNTVATRIGEKRGDRLNPRFRIAPPDFTNEQLLALIDTGATAEEAYVAWLNHELTPDQLVIHFGEGVPAEYAREL